MSKQVIRHDDGTFAIVDAPPKPKPSAPAVKVDKRPRTTTITVTSCKSCPHTEFSMDGYPMSTHRTLTAATLEIMKEARI